MEQITSRKNAYISYLRSLAADRATREKNGEYVCEGLSTLRDAIAAGAEITSVLWCEEPLLALSSDIRQCVSSKEAFKVASTLENSPGPVFTVKMPEQNNGAELHSMLVLENVQDPGNVGTVIRTANAFGINAVALVGSCADLFSPKVVRASMAAIFRQRVFKATLQELKELVQRYELPLYGAALHRDSQEIRALNLKRAAVAVGSEGKGLSEAFLEICDGTMIIPMQPESESLNAAVAASVIMWEMAR